MKTSDYRRIWIELVTKEFEKDFSYSHIAVRLKRVKFDRYGNIKPNRAGIYAESHFPSIVRLFREQCKGKGEIIQLSLF